MRLVGRAYPDPFEGVATAVDAVHLSRMEHSVLLAVASGL